MTAKSSDTLYLPEAPAIPGLSFRNYQGESDLCHILSLVYAGKEADHDDSAATLESVTSDYNHLTNCDPYQDVLFAEVNGQPAAYSRVFWWSEESSGSYIYFSLCHVDPQWRQRGLGRALLHHNQRRLREIAAGHPADAPKWFEAHATNFQEGSQTLLEGDGYQVVRRFWFMTRPNLADIPDLPLPEGLEVRPARPEHYRQIWEASHEAFRDHWGYSQPQEEEYQAFLASKETQPDLWQVAWEGDQVAGMILNFIDHTENEENRRKRGYTEGISVRRPWRRRGLARALLARSLRMHRDLGMTEAALGVDTENLSGANRLYESMGFQPVKVIVAYRKPMD